ncbi:MAG: HAD family hydrolase [Bacteroidetes bacterium]|nr:HAD family hydrolase [Bacteroidota bacterium]
MYTVFFDLDRTLISTVSGRELAYYAIRKGYVKPAEVFRNAVTYFLYKINLIDPQSMAEKMIRWTHGIPNDNFNELCLSTTEKRLIPSMHKEAINEIEFHRRNNARIVILSASVLQVCNPIAKMTGADDIICTVLESKNGYLTGEVSGKLCFGEEKKERLRDYCYKNNTNISESYYYGDSISDLPVFFFVGHPVCINPSGKLKKTTLRSGWKILNWSS